LWEVTARRGWQKVLDAGGVRAKGAALIMAKGGGHVIVSLGTNQDGALSEEKNAPEKLRELCECLDMGPNETERVMRLAEECAREEAEGAREKQDERARRAMRVAIECAAVEALCANPASWTPETTLAMLGLLEGKG
jgi:hypothetical protein